LQPTPDRGGATLTIDVHIEPDDFDRALRIDASRGLTSNPKELPPKWFYDHRGSQLFDQITRLPEYYPTRLEAAVLSVHREARPFQTEALQAWREANELAGRELMCDGQWTIP